MGYEHLLNKHYNLCNVTHRYFAPLHNGSAQVFGTWSVNVRFIQERLITNKALGLEPIFQEMKLKLLIKAILYYQQR